MSRQSVPAIDPPRPWVAAAGVVAAARCRVQRGLRVTCRPVLTPTPVWWREARSRRDPAVAMMESAKPRHRDDTAHGWRLDIALHRCVHEQWTEMRASSTCSRAAALRVSNLLASSTRTTAGPGCRPRTRAARSRQLGRPSRTRGRQRRRVGVTWTARAFLRRRPRYRFLPAKARPPAEARTP